MYTLADAYRCSPLSFLQIANEIYKPSCLSDLWALSYYGLIPEKVTSFTSVTTRVTRSFHNLYGAYTYSSLKKNLFWGFVSKKIENIPVWIATPEKALLDHWYLHEGAWTEDRLAEMRFQNTEQLNKKRLSAYAKKWGSLRLMAIVETFNKVIAESRKGYIEL